MGPSRFAETTGRAAQERLQRGAIVGDLDAPVYTGTTLKGGLFGPMGHSARAGRAREAVTDTQTRPDCPWIASCPARHHDLIGLLRQMEVLQFLGKLGDFFFYGLFGSAFHLLDKTISSPEV